MYDASLDHIQTAVVTYHVFTHHLSLFNHTLMADDLSEFLCVNTAGIIFPLVQISYNHDQDEIDTIIDREHPVFSVVRKYSEAYDKSYEDISIPPFSSLDDSIPQIAKCNSCFLFLTAFQSFIHKNGYKPLLFSLQILKAHYLPKIFHYPCLCPYNIFTETVISARDTIFTIRCGCKDHEYRASSKNFYDQKTKRYWFIIDTIGSIDLMNTLEYGKKEREEDALEPVIV